MLKTARLRIWYWGPAIAWATAIFVLSSLPIKPQGPVYPFEDKIVHILLFGILALLLLRALLWKQERPVRRAAILAFLITILYGVIDEWHQGFTPERTVDVWDWVADFAGAIFVFPAAALIKRTKSKSHDEGNREKESR